MRAAIVIMGYVLVCTVGFGVSVQSAEDPASEHSMTGCLRAGSDAGTFRLTDLGLADGPTTVEIAETTADLTPHVGHKVEITGVTIDGKDPSAHTMKVSAMNHLASSCP